MKMINVTIAHRRTMLWRGFLSLLYPPVCAGCAAGLSEGILCSSCASKLVRWPAARSLVDRLPPAKDVILLAPFGVYEKDALLARLIHDFKYRRQRHIGRALALLYAEAMASTDTATTYEAVLPVPMHWWRLSRRGFNQSTLIARVLAKQLQLPLYLRTLQRRRYTRQQVGMTARQRKRNMAGKFGLRRAATIQGKRLLLVDDVLTTGSTALTCAKTLLDGGAASVGICTLALRA